MRRNNITLPVPPYIMTTNCISANIPKLQVCKATWVGKENTEKIPKYRSSVSEEFANLNFTPLKLKSRGNFFSFLLNFSLTTKIVILIFAANPQVALLFFSTSTSARDFPSGIFFSVCSKFVVEDSRCEKRGAKNKILDLPFLFLFLLCWIFQVR